ncbi:MAG TPA: PEP/pyruvate-binding domain-containing protein, partial [Candidatus Dormibacteraeota bacterium]|nr:PEP/pyruvate-binding domain-containing protein [Candidatus Dormibacteraeota bacterium]
MPTGTPRARATRAPSTSRGRSASAPAASARRGSPAKAATTGANGARPRRRTTHKWVYLFEEGDASMRDLLGGKGAGVAEMTRAGLPVPPGFTITTEACNAFYENGKKF